MRVSCETVNIVDDPRECLQKKRGASGFSVGTHNILWSSRLREVGQDVGQVPLERPGRLDHGRDPRVRRPEVPGLEVFLRAFLVRVHPELAQRFLDRPRTARLELRAFDRRELLAAPVRDVLLMTQPQILRALQPLVAALGQRLVLCSSDLVHRCGHILGRVEPIEHDLPGSIRNVLLGRTNVRFPHVHGDRLDLPQCLRVELPVVALQTLLFPVDNDVFDGGAVQIADDALVFVSFARRLLVNADARRSFRASPRSTARIITPQVSSHEVPVSRVTPVTSHSLSVSIIRISNNRVNCDLGSAHGDRTCLTPSLGQLVRGRPA